MPHSTQPLAYHYPCFLTWRTNFFARDGEYPSTLVSCLPTTAPPFASPPTLSHPTVQVALFTQTTSATPVILVWHNNFGNHCKYGLVIKEAVS